MADKESKRKAKPTEYVILQQEGEAWRPVRRDGEENEVLKVSAANQADAILSFTGEGEKALQGRWKAVSWSAWKGTVVIEEPRQVVVMNRLELKDE